MKSIANSSKPKVNKKEKKRNASFEYRWVMCYGPNGSPGSNF